MARIVKVQDDSYKLSVNSGGTITLNTGNQIGTVLVTGDLTVLGNTTSIQTANVEIEDKIILLNRGEVGAGISPTNSGKSGIQISRGSRPDAFLIFDEAKNWLDTQTGTTRSGLFIAKNENDELMGLQTNSITTDGYNLNLLGTGTSVVNVTGTVNYEQQVLDYSAPGLPPLDPDIIPNIQAVTDYVGAYFTINPPFKIQDSAIIGGLTVLYDSFLAISDFEADGGPSNLTLTLDNVVNAAWFVDRFEVQNLKFYNATIESRLSNEDLVLRSDGTGCVGVDDHFKLYLQATDPASVVDGVKLYGKNEAQGGTGLFFVNSENTQDELISKRKAIVYSMIF
jgi:hypothetical protein